MGGDRGGDDQPGKTGQQEQEREEFERCQLRVFHLIGPILAPRAHMLT